MPGPAHQHRGVGWVVSFATEVAASLAIVFLVPGYICQSFYNLFVPTRRLDSLSTMLQ